MQVNRAADVASDRSPAPPHATSCQFGLRHRGARATREFLVPQIGFAKLLVPKKRAEGKYQLPLGRGLLFGQFPQTDLLLGSVYRTDR